VETFGSHMQLAINNGLQTEKFCLLMQNGKTTEFSSPLEINNSPEPALRIQVVGLK
jgi:hypothetical protein